MIQKRTFQLTEDGLSKIVAELEDLKSRRGEIAERIATARDFGDLKENAEYDAARTEQGMIETRISEIENIMLNAEMIDATSHNIVTIGSLVKIKNLDTKEEASYSIVGSIEADPIENKISDESPLGKALLNKKVDEQIIVTTPGGQVNYKIISLN